MDFCFLKKKMHFAGIYFREFQRILTILLYFHRGFTLREEIMAKEIVVEEKIAELKIANFV